MRGYPQPVTRGAGAKRVVKGKQARLNLINGKAGNRTGKTGRKNRALAGFCIICKNQTICKIKGGFQRISQPCCQCFLVFFYYQPIYHNLDIMFFLFIEGRRAVQLVKFAINTRPAKSFLQPARHFLAIFTFSPAYDRRQQIKACAFFHRQEDIDHLADGLRGNRQTGRR